MTWRHISHQVFDWNAIAATAATVSAVVSLITTRLAVKAEKEAQRITRISQTAILVVDGDGTPSDDGDGVYGLWVMNISAGNAAALDIRFDESSRFRIDEPYQGDFLPAGGKLSFSFENPEGMSEEDRYDMPIRFSYSDIFGETHRCDTLFMHDSSRSRVKRTSK